MKIISTNDDKNSLLYSKAIFKRCEKENIPCELMFVKTEEQFEKACKLDEWKLVLEPCKYKIPENMPKNLESKNTAIAISEFCKEIVKEHKLHKPTVVVVNRSSLIGKPLTNMLLDNDFTVTIAHSKTSKPDLEVMMTIADIVVLATGCDQNHLRLNNKHVIDASNDIKTLGRDLKSYRGMKDVGAKTIDIMLEKIRK